VVVAAPEKDVVSGSWARIAWETWCQRRMVLFLYILKNAGCFAFLCRVVSCLVSSYLIPYG
jgi:hypothetical protein